MARLTNAFSIQTRHVDGSPATLVNQVIIGAGVIPGTSRYTPYVKYVPCRNGLQENVIVPNAALVARIYIPEPLVGAATVEIHRIDDESTGWTGGN